MQIKQMKIDKLKPYENNPRNNEAAAEYVANSIREFGFKVPIVVDKDNIIVAGHTRYLAAQMLGLEEVPCIIADDLTPEQVKAFRLADNKTAEKASWDFEKLSEELNDILDLDLNFNLTDFGFGEFELDVLTNDYEPDGFPEEETEGFEGVGDKELKSFSCVIVCMNEDEKNWLVKQLGQEGELQRSYHCSKLMGE